MGKTIGHGDLRNVQGGSLCCVIGDDGGGCEGMPPESICKPKPPLVG